MKNIAIRTSRSLGAAVKARRLELGWSQAKLADQLSVQRQWVIRLESGSNGAEMGTVLRALSALGLSIVVGDESGRTGRRSAPAANLDEVFTRLAAPEPSPLPDRAEKSRSKKASGKKR